MIITDLKTQVKDKNRISVYVDGKFAFGITKEDAILYKLKINSEITKEKYDLIINENIFIKARDKTLKYLGYRARSKKEIIDKLSPEFNDDVIERVISLMEKYDYIDDRKFAESFAKDKYRFKSWSKKKISYELALKGVSKDIISEVLENLEYNPIETIAKILEKRLKGKLLSDYKEKQKQYNYLASKGYEFEDIKKAINMFSENNVN